MLLCSSYYQNDLYREKVDQIRFSMYNFNNALSYIMRRPNKEIIIEILALHEEREGKRVCPTVEKMMKLQAENPTITYDFYSIDDMLEYYFACKEDTEITYKYFHHFPVTSWNMVSVLLGCKVSDIVLGEPFVFMADEVNKYIHPFVRIRAYPHKGKPAFIQSINNIPSSICFFFMIPQYMNLCTHIDIFDLLDDNIVRESALIDVYTKSNYNFKLKHLIPSIGSDLTGAYLDEQFFTRRLNCHQACMKSPNTCHYCTAYEKMYETIAKKNEEQDIDLIVGGS